LDTSTWNTDLGVKTVSTPDQTLKWTEAKWQESDPHIAPEDHEMWKMIRKLILNNPKPTRISLP
jgi:hypothetical protein